MSGYELIVIALLVAILLAVIFPEAARWLLRASLKLSFAALVIWLILLAGWGLFENYLLPFFREHSVADIFGMAFLIVSVFLLIVRPFITALVEDAKDLITRVKKAKRRQ